jgi:hypothetical protein
MSRIFHHRANLWILFGLSLAAAGCRPPRFTAPPNTSGTSSSTSTGTGSYSDTSTGNASDTGTGSTTATGNASDTGSTTATGNASDTGTGSTTATGNASDTGTGSTTATGKPSDTGTSSTTATGSGFAGTNTSTSTSIDTGGNSSPDAGNAGRDAPQGSCASATATPCTGLPAFTGTQVLDGNDDDFCNVPSFELNFSNAASNGGKVKVYNGSSTSYPERALARVAWDASGIHAFIHVIDPNFVPATAVDTIYNADGIELLFTSTTSGLSGGTSQDSGLAMHVIVSPPFAARSQATGTNGSQTALPASQFVAATESSGYKVELKLPWPGTPPTSGAQIKFDMELNAADGVSTAGDAGPRDAQAILYLGSDPGGSPCAGELFPYCDDRLWCSTTLQ